MEPTEKDLYGRTANSWKEAAESWERAAKAWEEVPNALLDGAAKGTIIGLWLGNIIMILALILN